MQPYAAVLDLESRWRPLSAQEKARAEVLLQDAAVRIDGFAPPASNMLESELHARLIVSCDMVRRGMLAGDELGVTQQSVTRGPFSGQWTYANPSGDMYLTKAERLLLRGTGQRASSVSMLGGDP